MAMPGSEGQTGKFYARERTINEVLGRKAADLLLWKDRNASALLLAGTTLIWFLFEVVEYNFVTLLCHTVITTMLLIFIWHTAAEIFNWEKPKIPKIILDESAFEQIALTFRAGCNQLVSMLLDISCGRNLPQFLLAVAALYILSVIGTCCSFLNLLYAGLLCLQILPIVYVRYEDEIDQLFGRAFREAMAAYRWFDERFLNKIPRGPVHKEKKLS